MAGGGMNSLARSTDTAPSLLSVRGLTRHFGGLTAVEDVSFEIADGEMRCIIGPNGAGKSTVLNMLCGTLKPTAGSILFEGRDLARLSLEGIARAGIARKFQVPSVFETLSVADNLDVAEAGAGGAGTRHSVEEVLDLLDLRRLADIRGGALAHGQKQWLEIGMALVTGPKLLLLDEPTAGMSVEESLRSAAMLRQLAGSVAIIAIEHDMRFVRALACRTTVLHQGRVIAEGPFAEIEANTMVRDVYLGRQ
ncbi:ATP-binding cassette domain-containing protein [Rhodoligotrophos defluvii]|uniref:ATP-binding cassette domain-containing protein n=1 Tax=Rhodoligotrophos defluvii TaxID=2561934 RepID=UPI001EEFAA72|nr:ATP-binding cassette domain-containing protein [Rhodoligotrophos defluvii]